MTRAHSMPSPFVLVWRASVMEWRKQRKSGLIWLVAACAGFTPAAVLLVRLLQIDRLPALYKSTAFRGNYWNSLWESVVVFLMPMVIILVTAFLAQLEHRNNTWKQVSVLPMPQSLIYLMKLGVAVVWFALFLIAFVLAGEIALWIPVWLVPGVPEPTGPSIVLPLGDAQRYFVLGLPLLSIQFAIAMRFHGFLAPIGAGFLAWISALALLSWKHAWVVPYSHGILHYMAGQTASKVHVDPSMLWPTSILMTVVFVLFGMQVFRARPIRG